ncbi:MAG TPA: DUF4136 domain-containing protein [Woeseiaceae bacterium]|nr:DUF4136 domain-containing protein [Woeseiaceae bacterium]
MNLKKKGVFAAAILSLATIPGCASGPDIRSDFDRTADFSTYETFGFASELGTDRAGYTSLITEHFKRAIRRELETRGYEYTETNPDLLANFYVSVREQTDIRSTPSTTAGAGYYGYRYGMYTGWPAYTTDVRTVHYKAGTANIDLVDAKRKQLVWEGVAEGRVRDEALENPGPAIDAVVAELFARYPARAGSAASAD